MQGQDEGEFAGGGGGGGIQSQQQQQQPGMISSTWCCNPQFRLTVRKAAEVTVCVAQRDPQVRVVQSSDSWSFECLSCLRRMLQFGILCLHLTPYGLVGFSMRSTLCCINSMSI